MTICARNSPRGNLGAMSSIGWATNYGVGATALLALVALPAFLHLAARR